MDIFISWSRDLSHRVALALQRWIPTVVPQATPYVSSEDNAAGTKWRSDLDRKLREADFGIVCVTPDNLNSPWLHFEAGALQNAPKQTPVTPFLVGLKMAEIADPLRGFQCAIYQKDDVRNLVRAIHRTAGDDASSAQSVDAEFDAHWPTLQEELDPLAAEATGMASDQRLLDRLEPIFDSAVQSWKAKKSVSIAQTDFHELVASIDKFNLTDERLTLLVAAATHYGQHLREAVDLVHDSHPGIDTLATIVGSYQHIRGAWRASRMLELCNSTITAEATRRALGTGVLDPERRELLTDVIPKGMTIEYLQNLHRSVPPGHEFFNKSREVLHQLSGQLAGPAANRRLSSPGPSPP